MSNGPAAGPDGSDISTIRNLGRRAGEGIEVRYSALPLLSASGAFLTEAFRQLRQSLPIVWPLFLSHVRARHRAMLLSYLWLLLPAAATALICTYLQSMRVLAAASTELPYALHVLTGVLLWQLLVDGLQAPLQQLKASRQLIVHTRVPHEALILAGTLEALANCGARLLVLAAVLLFYGIAPSLTWLAVPVALVSLLVFGLALGVLIAPWGLLYDDVPRAVTLGLGMWFFLTPIFYAAPADGPLSYNPAAVLIETARSWLVGNSAAGGFGIVAFASWAALIAGWLLYRMARPHVLARLG
jgi:lipopolysaccharide transport system permease protein